MELQSHDILIAEHSNGTTVHLNNKLIIISVPFDILYGDTHVEYLENNRSLVISKCSFFHSYVGVGRSRFEAFSNLRDALSRIFTRLVQDNAFFEYLEKKQGFKVMQWMPSVKTDASYSAIASADV